MFITEFLYNPLALGALSGSRTSQDKDDIGQRRHVDDRSGFGFEWRLLLLELLSSQRFEERRFSWMWRERATKKAREKINAGKPSYHKRRHTGTTGQSQAQSQGELKGRNSHSKIAKKLFILMHLLWFFRFKCWQKDRIFITRYGKNRAEMLVVS